MLARSPGMPLLSFHEKDERNRPVTLLAPVSICAILTANQ